MIFMLHIILQRILIYILMILKKLSGINLIIIKSFLDNRDHKKYDSFTINIKSFTYLV